MLQHHRIPRSHTHTCDPFVIITDCTTSSHHPIAYAHTRRMRSVCNHHSKIVLYNIASPDRSDRITISRTHTHTCDVCDVCDRFVIITPRFMPPKRRFWKGLQKMKCVFSMPFSTGVSTRFGLQTIEQLIEHPPFNAFIFCSFFQIFVWGP